MKAKVHRISFDVDRYQSIFIDGDDAVFREWYPMITFDGTSRRARWRPPPVWIPEPRLEAPDFWKLSGAAALICGPRALDAIDHILEFAGELLPLPIDGMELSVLNVTKDVDCLDVHSSEVDEDGVPETYAFLEHRLPGPSLFKIPQTDTAEVLCWEGLPVFEDDFKRQVETIGLSGLRFTEVWDSVEGPRPSIWG